MTAGHKIHPGGQAVENPCQTSSSNNKTILKTYIAFSKTVLPIYT
jgi:hypothetical protein